MNKELAHELRLKLDDLPFVDVIAGMAQVLEYQDPAVDKGKTLIKKIPVSYDTNQHEGAKEIELIPNSARKGVLYFEDLGITAPKKTAAGMAYSSRLVLVCWMNKEKFAESFYAEITAKAITEIYKLLLTTNPIRSGIFSRLEVKAGRIMQQNKSVFSSYTYRVEETQYLRPPYEYFALELLCNYTIAFDCINEIVPSTNPCAPTINSGIETILETEDGQYLNEENGDFIYTENHNDEPEQNNNQECTEIGDGNHNFVQDFLISLNT